MSDNETKKSKDIQNVQDIKNEFGIPDNIYSASDGLRTKKSVEEILEEYGLGGQRVKNKVTSPPSVSTNTNDEDIKIFELKTKPTPDKSIPDNQVTINDIDLEGYLDDQSAESIKNGIEAIRNLRRSRTYQEKLGVNSPGNTDKNIKVSKTAQLSEIKLRTERTSIPDGKPVISEENKRSVVSAMSSRISDNAIKKSIYDSKYAKHTKKKQQKFIEKSFSEQDNYEIDDMSDFSTISDPAFSKLKLENQNIIENQTIEELKPEIESKRQKLNWTKLKLNDETDDNGEDIRDTFLNAIGETEDELYDDYTDEKDAHDVQSDLNRQLITTLFKFLLTICEIGRASCRERV